MGWTVRYRLMFSHKEYLFSTVVYTGFGTDSSPFWIYLYGRLSIFFRKEKKIESQPVAE